MSLDPNKTYLEWSGTTFPNSASATFKAPAGSTIDWGDGVVESFATASTSVNMHTYTDGKTEHTIAISGLTSIGIRAFSNCSSLERVTIGNSVTSIGDSAFYSCKSLTRVTIGNSVKSIGNWTFRDCTSLVSVTIPNSVTSIGKFAFYSCKGLKSVTIGNSITSISEDAFGGCSSLTSIIIPDSVKSIDSYAFMYCSKLKSITIPDGVTSIGTSAFSGCTSLTSITIGNSVTSIGSSAFVGCYKLIEVKNLSTLKITVGSKDYGYVGYYAKNVYTNTDGQSYLSTDEDGYLIYDDGKDKILVAYTGTKTDLTLPSGIMQIYGYTFSECSKLTSIIIFDSVTSIGNSAFRNCNSLKTIVLFPKIPPTLGSDAIPATTTIYVQQSSKEAYKTATNWTAFAYKIESNDIYLSLIRFNKKNKEYINRKIFETNAEIESVKADISANLQVSFFVGEDGLMHYKVL